MQNRIAIKDRLSFQTFILSGKEENQKRKEEKLLKNLEKEKNTQEKEVKEDSSRNQTQSGKLISYM